MSLLQKGIKEKTIILHFHAVLTLQIHKNKKKTQKTCENRETLEEIEVKIKR